MLIIKCSNCGYVLYKGTELKSPRDIAKKYDRRCPKCKAKLSIQLKSLKIEVRSASRRGTRRTR